MRLQQIEAERARMNMTQKDIASAVGVTEPTYRSWINGSRDMPISKLIALAKLFKRSTDYLLGYEPSSYTVSADVEVSADYSEIDIATRKANRLTALLKEANSLADELASKELKVDMSISC